MSGSGMADQQVLKKFASVASQLVQWPSTVHTEVFHVV